LHHRLEDAVTAAALPSATVAAVLLPGERMRVDAAGDGCFAVVHRDSVPDAVRVVRERAVDAVLLSVHRCPLEQVEAVRHLVHDFPGIPTVALVSQHDPSATEMLLRLGASGVQQVVDVTSPTGWNRLRQVVGQPATRAVARIQSPILTALAQAPADARLFVEAMIRLAPDTPTVTALAERLYVRPSTLMSRFARAGLPSPKNYLSAVRLLHAAYLFESDGLSVADVAYRLEYSSPQSFGRHLRAMLGVTALEFRRRYPFPLALERFIAVMVEPYHAVWRDFHPVAGVQLTQEPAARTCASPAGADRAAAPAPRSRPLPASSAPPAWR
jgi:AraC-like DNA-binding protein